MAYNNYFPAGYQPAYYPQQNSQPQMNNGIIWVQGEAAAKSYPVAPNSSVPLWDSEADVIYIKSADMSGMPSLKIIDYKLRDIAPRGTDISSQTAFATKDDISHLEKELNALRAKFELIADRKEEDSDGEQSVQGNK